MRIPFRHFAALLLFLYLLDLSCGKSDNYSFTNTQRSPLKDNGSIASAVEVQKTFREIFKLYSNKVVYISTEQTVQTPLRPFFRHFFDGKSGPRDRTEKLTGLGTGFVLSDDGYICTNYHVVADVDKIRVKVNHGAYNARIVGSDSQTDIALLKISPNKKLEPVFIGNSDDVAVGDWAIAIGNPFGLEKTFTTGVISATGRRDLDAMGSSQSHFQTDASINPGNSGGPLINIYGEVIGVNRMIYSQSGGNIGIGFAVPINKVKTVLEQISKHRKIQAGTIGVRITPLVKK